MKLGTIIFSQAGGGIKRKYWMLKSGSRTWGLSEHGNCEALEPLGRRSTNLAGGGLFGATHSSNHLDG